MNSELRKELMSIRDKIDQALAEPEEKTVWRAILPDADTLQSGYILFADGCINQGSYPALENTRACWYNGNWFPTREEAELERDKRQLLFEIKKWAEEQEDCKVNWRNDTEKKLYPRYIHSQHRYNIGSTRATQYQSIFPYFKTEAKYNEFMSIFGDRIKKTLIDKEL
jgi:hypothetical protein